MGFIIGLINGTIAAFGKAISFALSILPTSPLRIDDTIDLIYLNYLNYFVPVGRMVTIGISWLGCIALWYVAQIALRWAKAIE